MFYCGVSKNAELRYKVDVVVMKMSKDMQHRSLSIGEGEGGRGGIELSIEQNPEVCDRACQSLGGGHGATGDDPSTSLRTAMQLGK